MPGGHKLTVDAGVGALDHDIHPLPFPFTFLSAIILEFTLPLAIKLRRRFPLQNKSSVNNPRGLLTPHRRTPPGAGKWVIAKLITVEHRFDPPSAPPWRHADLPAISLDDRNGTLAPLRFAPRVGAITRLRSFAKRELLRTKTPASTHPAPQRGRLLVAYFYPFDCITTKVTRTFPFSDKSNSL